MGYVLEGPDGAGKTTLAESLSYHGFLVDHFGPPKRPPIPEYLHWLVDQDPTHDRVIDRFHLGESVYGPIFRGTMPLTIPELSTIEWALTLRGYTLVHVTRSLKELVDTLEQRGDDMVNPDQLGKVVEGYWQVMKMSFMPRWTYNWGDVWSGVLPLPKDNLASRDFRSYYRQFGVPGTGNLRPESVLVGEQANPNLQEQSRDIPFACGPAGDWLARAIWYNHWQPEVYLTNAKKPNGDEDMVAEEIKFLHSIQPMSGMVVLALGGKASQVLAKHKLKHAQVPHPAYHRRFAFNDGPAAYAKLLRDALPKP